MKKYTSPMPPAPRAETISYGPSRTPGASAMTLLRSETGNRLNYRGFQPRAALAALVHESELACNDPNPQALHLPIAYESGLPSSVI